MHEHSAGRGFRSKLAIAAGVTVVGLALAVMQSERHAAGQSNTPMRLADLRDQSCDGTVRGLASASNDIWKAQTFVPGIGGRLTRVEVPGALRYGEAQMHIRTTREGLPASIDIAATKIGANGVATFSVPVHLVPGELYALVVSAPDGRYDWTYSDSQDCYPDDRGGPSTSYTRGRYWMADRVDFFFTTYMEPDSVVPTPLPSHTPSPTEPPHEPLPPSTPMPNRPPAQTRRTTFVISLPTGKSDAENVMRQSRAYAAMVEQATAYRGYDDPTARPYLAFDIYQDRVFVETQMPPRPGAVYDLSGLFDKYAICNLVDSGAVDEVWIWEGGQGGLPEWAISGPEWENLLGTRIPSCGRQLATMVLHNGLDMGYALHSFGHRLERTFQRHFACDLSTDTWPWYAGVRGCIDGTASDRTGYVARPFDGNDWISACGDIHHPPNITSSVDYKYGSWAPCSTICEDWQRDGTATAREITCRRWGCTQLGFMLYWMQNLPGSDNDNRDIHGRPQPNWWPYIFGRPTPVPTPTIAAPTPTTAVPSPTTAAPTPTTAVPTPTTAAPTPTTAVPTPVSWHLYCPATFGSTPRVR